MIYNYNICMNNHTNDNIYESNIVIGIMFISVFFIILVFLMLLYVCCYSIKKGHNSIIAS